MLCIGNVLLMGFRCILFVRNTGSWENITGLWVLTQYRKSSLCPQPHRCSAYQIHSQSLPLHSRLYFCVLCLFPTSGLLPCAIWFARTQTLSPQFYWLMLPLNPETWPFKLLISVDVTKQHKAPTIWTTLNIPIKVNGQQHHVPVRLWGYAKGSDESAGSCTVSVRGVL